MSSIGVIPARYGSTRLPGKSLVPLCGKPLVQWVYERASRARELSQLVVATDDERIASAVKSFGGRVVMTRAGHPSGTDRVAEAARGSGAEIVVNIQGDEPLIEPALIDGVAKALRGDAPWDMATAACLIRDRAARDNPSIVKVVFGESGGALYFSRAAIPHLRDGTGRARAWRHIGIYGYRSAFLERLVKAPPCELEEAEKLEQLRALYIGARMKVIVTDHEGLGVDTPADVPLAEAALRKAGLAR